MNQNTRQRITGTIVLAVTALVLLPIIFDGEGSYQAPLQTDIPARPLQPEISRNLPQRPVITADTDEILTRPVAPESALQTATPAAENESETTSDETSPVVSSTADVSSPDNAAEQTAAVLPEVAQTPVVPGPALDPRGLPEAWSVRLGAFSSETNATNLVARLQQTGHRAYTRRVSSNQGVLTAVFVGPLIDRSSAQSLMESLRQDFQLNGLIVRYEIDEL